MTAPSEDDIAECDFPGCPETVPEYEPDDDEAWPIEPPPGWYSTVVARHGVHNVSLLYCSQDHLAAGLSQHLPDARPKDADDGGGWRDDLIGCSAFLAFGSILLLGLITAVRLLADLVGWLGDRL